MIILNALNVQVICRYQIILMNLKDYRIKLNSMVLLCRKSASLSETHEQLARPTIKELKYDET